MLWGWCVRNTGGGGECGGTGKPVFWEFMNSSEVRTFKKLRDVDYWCWLLHEIHVTWTASLQCSQIAAGFNLHFVVILKTSLSVAALLAVFIHVFLYVRYGVILWYSRSRALLPLVHRRLHLSAGLWLGSLQPCLRTEQRQTWEAPDHQSSRLLCKNQWQHYTASPCAPCTRDVARAIHLFEIWSEAWLFTESALWIIAEWAGLLSRTYISFALERLTERLR